MNFARFDYTRMEGEDPVPVYVNPAYVAAVRPFDDNFTSIWINGVQFPILVDQSVGWVYDALEHASK